jgi:hypothetical protein
MNSFAPFSSLLHSGTKHLLSDYGFAIRSQARLFIKPNRVRILRTALSLPVALHPALLRRSYFQLPTWQLRPDWTFTS